ncbi:MAG TPA: MXAN_2562 family outer membrane beta-barrel protein [Kofleriaceae bacterium]
MTVLVLLASLGLGGVATADSGMLPNGATLTFDKLFIHEDGNKDLVEPKIKPDSLWKYFNLAHCQCGKSPPQGFVETEFAYLMTLQSQVAPSDRELQFWVGQQCDSADPNVRNAMCHQVKAATIPHINDILQQGATVKIPVYDFMTLIPSTSMETPDCTPAEQDGRLWAIAALAGGSFDFFQSTTIKIDSKAPDLPTEFHAAGGDNSINISWKAPISTLDTYAYQALCARADNNMPGRTSGRPDPRYMTALNLCGIDPSVNLGDGTAVDVPGGDPVAAGDLPPDLKNLSPEFLCGDVFSPTAESLRIEGLENGVAYKVVVLAVDKFQNATGTFLTSTVTPVPSTDFWEDIHDRGSKVEGGLCLLAETYGDDSALTGALRAFRDDTLGRTRAGRWLADAYYATIGKLGGRVHGSIALRIVAAIALAPLVALALAWHWVTLPGLLAMLGLAWLWRRRRLPRWLARTAPVGAALAVMLVSSRASAGGGYQPYWENSNIKEDSQSLADEPGLVTWHVGIRVGPYVPDIDKQFTGSPGPYEQMFGGYRVLPMLDVDRILWTRVGQVGVGLSIGYMQKTARTFAMSSDREATDRARAADENKFRLIPMALTGTYRFTWFDDNYGVPVVPYVRGGLSYYLWWVSVNGELASACTAATAMEAMCTRTKALGASFGLQGSIGLAIRAERIDAPTAMSMQQSGIQHAGVYAELSLAKVDGFGSDSKLSVGDRTWFAGVDFEF